MKKKTFPKGSPKEGTFARDKKTSGSSTAGSNNSESKSKSSYSKMAMKKKRT